MKLRILLPLYSALGLTLGAFGANPTWVTVGDPGVGDVFQTFSISKFEITNEQYAEFLNATARNDPNGLYNTDMGRTSDPLILRSGIGGSFTYRVVASFAKHPVAYVRGDDVRRYCNWLHNGKGSGSTENGAYDMSGNATPSRNLDALVWVPDFWEWSKAAFYSPLKPGYYNYATQNDIRPTSARVPSTLTNAANHYWDDTEINGINGGYALTNSPVTLPGRYTAPVGSYPASRSYYGTLDQNGNVSELIEGGLTPHIGGSFTDRGLDQLIRSHGVRVWVNDAEVRETGFRIAAVAPLVVDSNPVPLIVPIGAPASFTSSVIGLGGKMQWRKGSTNVGPSVAGNMSDYDIAAARLTDAGAYSMRSTSIVGPVTSTTADLVVVDTMTTVKHVFKETQTVSMTAVAAGNVTGYLWKKDGGDIVVDEAARFSGITGKKLTIKKLKATDAGVYTCEVTGAGGMLVSAAQTLFIVNAVPEITPGQTLDDAMVGGVYPPKLITVVAGDNQVAATFSAKGLPAGMKINPVTGEIYGTPTAPKLVPVVYTVLITAKNPIGTSTTETILLTVQPIPAGAVGKFVGVIARNVVLNENLGGRLEITSTPAGAYSGKVVLGGKSYGFRGGKLEMKPGVNNPKLIEIKRSKMTSLFLTWTVDPVTNLIAGTLADTEVVPNEADISGWRNKWNAKTAVPEEYLGYYTLRLDPQTAAVDIPAGDGYGTFTVAKAGTLKVAGKLPDNTAYTVSTFIGPTGQIAIFQSLYKNQGSILSSMVAPVLVTPAGAAPGYVDSSVAGTINWLKKLQPASVKNYPNAFQDNLTVTGMKYNPVATGTNALGSDVTTAVYAYQFSEGGDLGAASRTPNANFALSATHKATVPVEPVNFAKTTLSLKPKTGLFKGKFTLVDNVLGRNVTRTVTYQGVVIRDSAGLGVGYGFFMLGQLPTPTTSLQSSGAVKIGVP